MLYFEFQQLYGFLIETTHIPNWLFYPNCVTKPPFSIISTFQLIAQYFCSFLMMSNSDYETAQQTIRSKVRFADQARPSKAPQNTTTPSTPGMDKTHVTITPSSDDLYTDTFNFSLSKIYSRILMESLTSKVAILKEVKDSINTSNEKRCRQISPCIHSYGKDFHLKNGCVCVDDRIAFRNSNKDAYIEAIHAAHTGSWGMTGMPVHAWWPYMHRDLLSKTAKCNPCVKIGQNLKSINSSSKWAPFKLCKVPNEDIQLDFGGPIYNEKNQEVYFLHV